MEILHTFIFGTVCLSVCVCDCSCRSRSWRQRMTVWRWKVMAAGRAPRPPSHPLLHLTHTVRPRGPGRGSPSTALTSPPASPPAWVRQSWCHGRYSEYALTKCHKNRNFLQLAQNFISRLYEISVNREGIISSNKQMTYDVRQIVIVRSLKYPDVLTRKQTN